MKKKNVLIGCGEWGARHAKVLFELNELYGVYDIDTNKSEILSKKFNVYQFKSINEIIKYRKEILSLFICSSAETHYKIIFQTYKYFDNFFVEKPLVHKIKDLEKIKKLLNGKKIFVGHLMHFHPAIKKIETILKSKKLGQIKSINLKRHNLGRYRSYENVIQSFAPHDFSIIFRLFGFHYKKLNYQSFSIYKKNHIDKAQIFFSTKNNVKVNLSVSWTSLIKEQKITIFGSKGILVFSDTEKEFNKKIKITKIIKKNNILKKTGELFLKLKSNMPLTEQAKNVITCFRGKKLTLPNNLNESKFILGIINKIK